MNSLCLLQRCARSTSLHGVAAPQPFEKASPHLWHRRCPRAYREDASACLGCSWRLRNSFTRARRDQLSIHSNKETLMSKLLTALIAAGFGFGLNAAVAQDVKSDSEKAKRQEEIMQQKEQGAGNSAQGQRERPAA